MSEELVTFFKALADTNRLKIVGLLAEKAYSVEELAALLQVETADRIASSCQTGGGGSGEITCGELLQRLPARSIRAGVKGAQHVLAAGTFQRCVRSGCGCL